MGVLISRKAQTEMGARALSWRSTANLADLDHT